MDFHHRGTLSLHTFGRYLFIFLKQNIWHFMRCWLVKKFFWFSCEMKDKWHTRSWSRDFLVLLLVKYDLYIYNCILLMYLSYIDDCLVSLFYFCTRLSSGAHFLFTLHQSCKKLPSTLLKIKPTALSFLKL